MISYYDIKANKEALYYNMSEIDAFTDITNDERQIPVVERYIPTVSVMACTPHERVVTTSIPTSATHIRFDKLDVIVHKPSNTELIETLTNQIKDLEASRQEHISTFIKLTKLIKDTYNTVLACEYYKSVVESGQRNGVIDILSESSALEILGDEFNIKNDKAALEIRINELRATIKQYSDEMARTKSAIHEYPGKITALHAKIILEQFKYMQEMQANPAKILDSEEVFTAYWENELTH